MSDKLPGADRSTGYLGQSCSTPRAGWWHGHRSLMERVDEIEERLDQVEASQQQNQASIDAEQQAVAALGPKLDTLKAEIDALKTVPAGQALDFSGVDKALADIGARTDADVADAAPAAPAGP